MRQKWLVPNCQRKVTSPLANLTPPAATRIASTPSPPDLSVRVRGRAAVDAELKDVRKVLEKHSALIAGVYSNYCAVLDRAYDGYVMSLLAWDGFLRDIGVVEDGSRFCKQSDLDIIFVSTNVEVKGSEVSQGQKAVNQANADTALMRFEFLQALTRVAVAKFVKSKEIPDVSEAVDELLTNWVATRVTPEALCDTDVFRQRLYTRGCSDVLKKHTPSLKMVFDYYAAGTEEHAISQAGRSLSQQEWESFLFDVAFIDDRFTKDDGTLCFIWAQAYVTDEVKRREKLIHLNFLGFLEAVARLICFKPMPAMDDIMEANAGSASQYFQMMRDGLIDAPHPLKPSWQEEECSEAPLAPQLDLLIGLLLDRIDENGDGIVTRQELKARALAAKNERSRRVSTYERRSEQSRSHAHNIQDAGNRVERIKRQNTTGNMKRKASQRRMSSKALPESFPLPQLIKDKVNKE
jgi:hypothetical protein